MKSSIITFIISLILLIPASGQGQWEIVNVEIDAMPLILGSGEVLLPIECLYDVQFIDRDKGFFSGGAAARHYGYGVLYKTEDGGNTWNHIDEDFAPSITSIHFVNESKGFSVVREYFLYTSSDGGYSWTKDTTFGSVSDIFFLNDSIGWAYGGNWDDTDQTNVFLIYKTIDGGDSWNEKSVIGSAHGINSLFFIDEESGWAVGAEGLIAKYNVNDGWKTLPVVTDLPLEQVVFIDQDNGWITGGYNNSEGSNSIFMRTVNGGETWTKITGLPYRINDFYFENKDHGWAVGVGWLGGAGAILETYNGGLDWDMVKDSLPARLNALYIGDGVGWAVGDDGLILKTKYASSSVNRFMVVGDPHNYSPSPDLSQTMLYEIALAAIEEEVDFIFFTGDLVVRGFDSPEKENSVLKDWRFVLDTLGHHNIKVYACRGNNDISSRQAWESLFSGTWSFPQNGPGMEKNITYAIDYDNLLFVALDQYTDYHKINQVWLDDLLATTTSEHIFVAGHEPAFKVSNSCMSTFPENRNLLWESLTDASVKAYFSGHDHFYDHTIINDGDGNPDNDIHQVITGTGGGSLHGDGAYDGDNGRWTPDRLFHEKENGYVLVELNGAAVEMKWKKRIGQNLFEDGGDSFIFSQGTTNLQEIQPGYEYLVNYPNPFQSSTIISYQLPAISDVELCVYDISGRKVSSLVNETQQADRYEVEWNADGMESGIYFCELKTGQGRQVAKMILAK